jgi:N-acyl-D-aspartate/D-glutamate deacylase
LFLGFFRRFDMDSEFDVLIRNAMVVDGTGKPPYKASIAIQGERVTSIGEVSGAAKKEVDASGLIASPGFIDAHSHADSTLLFYPKCESYVMQGVTLFVGGQCGGSPGPIGNLLSLPGIASEYINELVSFKFYPEKSLFSREQVNQIMKEHFGWTVDWDTIGDFFQVVEKKGISMNYAQLCGHGTVRYCVMGEDYKRHSTKTELSEMKGLIRQAMEDGCIGISAGLDYDPDVWASREEMNECVAIMKDYDAVYAPHWRRTGRRRDIKFGERRENKVDGILEVIDTCRKTGVPTHLAHLTPGWRLVPEGNEVMEEASRRATLKFIDDARAEGLDVTFDAMPWFIFGGFNEVTYLCSLFSPWLRERGSREEFAKWLKVPDYRQEIKDALFAGKWYIREAYNPNMNAQWAENLWVVKHKSPNCENKNLAQIAKERGRDPFDVWFDLIAEDPHSRAFGANVADSGNFPKKPVLDYVFFKHPFSSYSLDTSVYDDKREQKSPPYGLPNITTYSAFPAFIIEYVREEKIFTLEQAIRKLSTSAAEAYRLKDRGILRPNSYADIVLFNLENLKVLGNPVEPRTYPKGIEYVFVNGTAVVEKGQHTGATPGKVVKRGT